jgi:hypothetical protein
LPVEARPVSGQQTPVRRFPETQHDLARQTLGRSIALEALAIVAKHAVFRSGPQKTRSILKEDLHGQVGQTVFLSVIPETVLLRIGRDSESEAGEDSREM